MRDWLKEIRQHKEMTQEGVAAAAGMSRQYYNMIENGQRGEPLPVDTAKKIAAILGFEWQRFYPDEVASVTENNREANQ